MARLAHNAGTCVLAFLLLFVISDVAGAIQTDTVQFNARLGFGEYGFDTGYLGYRDALARMQVRAYGTLGLNLADVTMNGTARVDSGLIDVYGTQDGGNFSFSLGLEYGAYAYYGIPVLGLDYEIDLLALLGGASVALLLEGSQTFTPFLLDSSIQISDSSSPEKFGDFDVTNILFPGIPFVGAGVTLDADMELQENLSGERIYFSNPGSSIYSESSTLSFSGSSTILSYYEDADAEVIVGLWPGLYVDAFGWRFDFPIARIPVTVYSSDLPLPFNNSAANFSGSIASINLTLNLNPSSTTPSSPVTASGTAYYNTGQAVPAGTVSISVSGQVYTAAISNGSYSRTIHAPSSSGNYTISALANDGLGRTGSDSKSLQVTSGSGGSGFIFGQAIMCRDGDDNDPWGPIDERDVFGDPDTYITCWVELLDLDSSAHTVKWKWYSPDGTLRDTSTWDTNPGPWLSFRTWWTWSIPADSWWRDMEGEWKVKVYVDNIYQTSVKYYMRYDLTEHRMCKDVDVDDPWDYHTPTNIFYQTDEKAVAWYQFENVRQALELKWKLYEPNGSQYLSEWTGSTDTPTNVYWTTWRHYTWMNINGYAKAQKCGDWHIEFYVKDIYGNWDLEYDDYFQILENPNVNPTISVSANPSAPIETQSVSLSTSASDNTYLDTVELHWKLNGVEQTPQTASNLNKSQHSISRNISSFGSGAQIEYWAVAIDTSGNRTETAHTAITIMGEVVTAPARPSGETYLQVGQSGTYTTGGSTTSLGHSVEYEFDWGDSVSGYGSATQGKSWPSEGYYFVRAHARCQTHTNRESAGSTPFSVTVESTNPTVDIITNGGIDFQTDQSQVVISGTATDSGTTSGLASVSINTGNTNEGILSEWQFTVDLVEGDNTLTVTATDNTGNVSQDTIVVTYVAAQPIIYVDDDATAGANNGLNWDDAFVYLQDALSLAANSGGVVTEIRVAQGTYTPDANSVYPAGTGDRTASFQLINGVALKGGYFGIGAADPNERDIEQYETVLSGDLNANDGPYFANNGENCYHIFYHPSGTNLDSTAVLDGFTITAGNANGSFPHQSGGGICNKNDDPTIVNCTFNRNQASHDGGGIYNSFSDPEVRKCIFSRNKASHYGGGMCNRNSSPLVTNCIFSYNSENVGSGMGNYDQSNPLIYNCDFHGNVASASGGGMSNETSSSPRIINCSFSGNIASLYGGGIINGYYCSPMIVNCTFSCNSAYYGGGGIDNSQYSNTTIDNCILWGNIALYGPQIYNDGTSSATVTFSNVQSEYPGSGNIDEDPLFTDPNNGNFHLLSNSPCIDAGDSNSVPVEITTDLDGRPRFVDDILTADTGVGTPPIVDMGAYEFGALYVWADSLVDPELGTPTNPFRHIQDAIDAATGHYSIRVAAGTYEECITLKDGISLYGGYDGTDWYVPRDPSLNETVIDANSLGSVVTIVDADVIIDGFTITEGLADNGGGIYCENSNLTLSNCAIGTNRTSNGADGFYGEPGGVGGNSGDGAGIYSSYSVVEITNCSISGNATGGGGGGGDGDPWQGGTGGNSGSGAGIYSSHSVVEITDSGISGNATGGGGDGGDGDGTGGDGGDSGSGAGIYCSSSSLTITDCDITGNTTGPGGNGGSDNSADGGSSGSGGGLYCYAGSLLIEKCIISRNRSGSGGNQSGSGGYGGDTGNGAGICCIDSNILSFSDCEISDNTVGRGGNGSGYGGSGGGRSGSGGGVYLSSSDAIEISQCSFTSNEIGPGGGGEFGVAGGSGGGIYCSSPLSVDIIHCEFTNNQAGNGGFGWSYGGSGGDGGGVVIVSPYASLTDCRFVGNRAGSGQEFFEGGSGGAVFCSGDLVCTHCTIQNNTAGSNEYDRPGSGGGLYCGGGSTILDCLITNNSSGVGAEIGGNGGGIYAGSTLTLTSCTVAYNTANTGSYGDGNGGGIYFASDAEITNSILWGNIASGVADESAQIYGGTPTVNYCCIQGWTGSLGGVGVIGNDPLFADPNNGNFHLLPDSPCIDAGDSNSVPVEIITDLDGKPRFVDDILTADTGAGTPPVVDMGAYEFQLEDYPPVTFSDPNLKTAIENILGIDNPTAIDMLALTSLTAESSSITDLTGLEYATNLTLLALNYNQISDISVLSSLTNLTFLNLSNNQISDIAVLSNLTNLTSLRLSYNQIRDIAVLPNLTNLTRLFLSHNQISDITVLSNLANLTYLLLTTNQINDISVLSNLTKLTFLRLAFNQISEISALSNLTNLTHLDLYLNQFSDISSLANMTNLEYLRLTYNPLNVEAYTTYLPMIESNNPGLETFEYDHDDMSPTVDITTNGGVDYTTTSSQIVLQGTVNDPSPTSGVASVSINTADTNEGTLSEWQFTVDLVEGENTLTITATDNAGNTGVDDIAVTYYRDSETIYVDDDAPNDPEPNNPDVSDPDEDGSPEHPFDEIQEAIDVTIDGDTVIVLEGTYYENVLLNGNDITLTSTNPNDAEVVANTVIDGSQWDTRWLGSVVAFEGTETEACILNGFTISNGIGNEIAFDGQCGGGICGYSTLATISNCVIIHNNLNVGEVPGNGGGIWDCDGPITDCIISNNFGAWEGGGGGIADCDGPITRCLVTNNRCQWSYGRGGGGLYNCDGPITGCIITGNSEYGGNRDPGKGGGLSYCDGLISNCLIAGNYVYSSTPDYSLNVGGGLYRCNGVISSCTIIGNMTEDNGGDVGGGLAECTGTITNCIIWGNVAPNDSQLYSCSDPTYSCIQDWSGGGEGNISDPLFADPRGPDGDPNTWEDNDYHLKSQFGRWDPNSLRWIYDSVTSPCIDAGDPNDDWTAELWPHGRCINIGAYGGTSEASMSSTLIGNPADLDLSQKVDIVDYAMFGSEWSWSLSGMPFASDLDRNGRSNTLDLAIFAENWLVEDRLVGYWRFDESYSPLAYDLSIHRNHAQVFGDPKWLTGRAGNFAIDLDGDGDYVRIERVENGLNFAPNSFSVSAWINTRTVTGGWRTILEYNRKDPDDPSQYGRNWFGLWLNAEGEAHFRVGSEVMNSLQALEPNEWYLLTATFNATDQMMRLYVDGVLDSSKVKEAGPFFTEHSAGKLTIGSGGEAEEEYFDGLLDDLRIYNRILGEDDIQQLLLESKAELVGHWKFDETDGVTAGDSSGLGNTGTLINGPVWTGSGELLFDGVDDYVEVPDSGSLDLDNEVTISVWIYLNEYGTDSPKVVIKPHSAYADPWEMFSIDLSHYGTYPRFIITDGIAAGQGASAYDNTITLDLNQWYHVVGTYDGSTIALYLDGQLIASNPSTIAIGQNDMPLSIGGRLGEHNSFDGLIDEVLIYNRALTENEVEVLYESHLVDLGDVNK